MDLIVMLLSLSSVIPDFLLTFLFSYFTLMISISSIWESNESQVAYVSKTEFNL